MCIIYRGEHFRRIQHFRLSLVRLFILKLLTGSLAVPPQHADRCVGLSPSHGSDPVRRAGRCWARGHARQVFPSGHVPRPRDVHFDNALGAAESSASLLCSWQIDPIDPFDERRRGKFTSSDLSREADHCTAVQPTRCTVSGFAFSVELRMST